MPEPAGYRTQGGAIDEQHAGLSAIASNLLDRLDSVLSATRRINNRIHGSEPKAANGPMPPHDSDAPLARQLERAHRLLGDIGNELGSIESRL
jgi:hypothetical protein